MLQMNRKYHTWSWIHIQSKKWFTQLMYANVVFFVTLNLQFHDKVYMSKLPPARRSHLIKKKQKIKATKIPPAQSDRLRNATLASKTALHLSQFLCYWCGFSIRLPASVPKSLQTFTLFRTVCGLPTPLLWY